MAFSGIGDSLLAALLFEGVFGILKNLSDPLKIAIEKTETHFLNNENFVIPPGSLKELITSDKGRKLIETFKQGGQYIEEKELAVQLATFSEIHFPDQTERLSYSLEITQKFKDFLITELLKNPKTHAETLHHILSIGFNQSSEQSKILLQEIHKVLDKMSGKEFPFQDFEKIDLDQLPFKELKIGDVEEFVGRKEALSWLEKYLLPQKTTRTLTIVSVQGAGGMGKTFLARKFIDQYLTERTSVEIFVGERPAFEAGLEFLSRLGLEIDSIHSEDQLKKELKSCFANRSGCLVLDDVCNEDVRILIPDNLNWCTLITTRKLDIAKKLAKNRVLELDKLSVEEAVDLFEIVLQDNFDSSLAKDYQHLAKYLGLRPYSVRLAANSLKSSLITTPPKELLQQLIEKGLEPPRLNHSEDLEDLHQLQPLLKHCLHQLNTESPSARMLLNNLAVCSDEGIEAQYFLAWQQKDHSAENIKHELLLIKNFSLLFLEEQNFSVFGETHDIVRIRLHTDLLNLLREASLENEKQSLQSFLYQALVLSGQSIELYRSLQFQVNHLIAGLKDDSSNTESLYNQFWSHLYRTSRLQWAYDLGVILLQQDEKRGDKAGLSTSYGNQALILQAWGKLDEAMALHQKQEALCEQLGDKAGLSACYGNQAVILKAWGKLDEAMALHKKQESLCHELGDKAGLSISYGNQALILSDWGKLDEAMVLHQKQESLCHELGDKAGLSACYGNQAVILKAWGKLDEAMALHKKQESLCEQLGDKARLSACYGNQAVILQAWGILNEAMALLKKQESLCEQLGDKARLSACYGNQAVILSDWGILNEAMALHQKEESLKEELGDKARLSRSYGNQALILQAWGKLDEAMALHQKEESLKEELGDKAGLSVCYGNQAVILSAWGKLDEAMVLHQKEESLCEELGDKAGLSRSYGNQAVILIKFKKYRKAMEFLEKKEIFNEEMQNRTGQVQSILQQANISFRRLRFIRGFQLWVKSFKLIMSFTDEEQKLFIIQMTKEGSRLRKLMD